MNGFTVSFNFESPFYNDWLKVYDVQNAFGNSFIERFNQTLYCDRNPLNYYCQIKTLAQYIQSNLLHTQVHELKICWYQAATCLSDANRKERGCM